MSSRGFSKRLETEATFTSSRLVRKKKKRKIRRKDARTKIGNFVYSCRYAYKLEESKAYVLVINEHGLHTT